ncbi:uncharacterized protein F5Z01DRAFT_644936 [Emericellopsis atlantica]|uniref:Uncharacterized protein n=1 Tax=Emericellopsis atlantica TaxID=2614577 RepID=A0A9P8CSF2_9HYPO|nr:uncharacterized protein F5Z01DRAFT_644936 [Emericellopsis atlantica]KAG9258029.1 hypothetical protein F5Z01DRAFT_644936 [Emericellopsis atlantica]
MDHDDSDINYYLVPGCMCVCVCVVIAHRVAVGWSSGRNIASHVCSIGSAARQKAARVIVLREMEKSRRQDRRTGRHAHAEWVFLLDLGGMGRRMYVGCWCFKMGTRMGKAFGEAGFGEAGRRLDSVDGASRDLARARANDSLAVLSRDGRAPAVESTICCCSGNKQLKDIQAAELLA